MIRPEIHSTSGTYMTGRKIAGSILPALIFVLVTPSITPLETRMESFRFRPVSIAPVMDMAPTQYSTEAVKSPR